MIKPSKVVFISDTITADNEVELISAILEWSDHKEYERRFKY